MAFTYDLSTDRGVVRLQLADTNAQAFVFEDAEIDKFLSRGGSVNEATCIGLRTLLVDAARRARYAKNALAPGQAYSDTSCVTGLQAALKVYGGDLPTVNVVSLATQPYDSGYVEQPVISTS
jgi:hypothetical protein